MRMLARHLGMPASHLSNILSGKKNLSASAAARVAGKLGWGALEKERFVLLVQLELEKDPDLRQSIQGRLSELSPSDAHYFPDIDLFQTISDWYHLPILEMTELSGGIPPSSDVARRLGISKFEVEAALERMTRLEMLEVRDGKYQKAKDGFEFRSAAPHDALRKFHRQMLEKALIAIDVQSPQEKYIGSKTFAADPAQLEAAKVIIRKCLEELVRLFSKGKNRSEIFHAGVQLFSVTEKGVKK